MDEGKIAELANKAVSIRRIVLSATYAESYWICHNAHRFARGELEHPHQCPECESKLVQWISGPRNEGI